MENKQIFEVGDRVFDYSMGWGEVVEIVEHCKYPIVVLFELGSRVSTRDGRIDEKCKPTLSFTEYNLVTGGFSQERPIEIPKRGQLVWVRNYEFEIWSIRYFIEMKNKRFIASKTNNENNCMVWDYLTTKNPYQNS